MKSVTKKWLTAGAVLVILGLILFAGTMFAGSWDFTALDTTEYETNTHVLRDTFQNITLNTDTADISFLPSGDDSCKVVCMEAVNQTHSVTVADGTLTIRSVDNREWHDYISLFSKTPTITIYLPEQAYGSLSIREDTGDVIIPGDFTFEKLSVRISTGDVVNEASVSGEVQLITSTGDIRLQNMSADSIHISTSTGDAVLTGIRCGTLLCDGNTGDVRCTDVITAGQLRITLDTGNVNFDRCDAAEIYAETSTGSIKGSLLSEKIFLAESDTGTVKVPQTTTGGKCQITTDTGSIYITLK